MVAASKQGRKNRTKNACGQKDNQDEHAVAFNGEIAYGHAGRHEIGDDLAAVQGRNGEEVEQGKAQIDDNPHLQHREHKDVGAAVLVG